MPMIEDGDQRDSRSDPGREVGLEHRPEAEHRQHHQSLRLDQHRDRGEPPCDFVLLAENRHDAEQGDERHHRIALAPDHGVEQQRRIQRDHQHRDERHLGPAAAPHEGVHQDREREVGDDRGTLDYDAVEISGRTDRVREDPRHPQRVEVAGRIVEEESLLIGMRGTERRDLARPRLVVANVGAEAGTSTASPRSFTTGQAPRARAAPGRRPESGSSVNGRR